jgi:hypothetical protein
MPSSTTSSFLVSAAGSHTKQAITASGIPNGAVFNLQLLLSLYPHHEFSMPLLLLLQTFLSPKLRLS